MAPPDRPSTDEDAVTSDDWASSGAAWDAPPSGADLGAFAPDAPTEDILSTGGLHPFDLPADARYEDAAELGRGGMGRVLASTDLRLRRQVARKEVAADDTETTRRLTQEVWITAQLDHPGIVTVFDAGRSRDGRLFYTMRLIRGRSLHDALLERVTLDQRLQLLRHYLDACEAVAYAHSQGVIHRDLKPANIMVGEFGETQVMDWGLARTLDDEQGRALRQAADLSRHGPRTVTGAVVGTPAYMSPEQAAGDAVDCRTDVWSLGVVLYELLAGRPPFSGQSSRKVLAQVLSAQLPPLPADAPRELAAIVDRALQREPADRYPDARALAQDVQAFLDGRRVDAFDYRPVDLARRLGRAWRAPLLVAAGALAFLLLGGLMAWQRTTTERDRARSAEAAADQARVAGERHLARALLGQARAAALVEARGEAEVLAAHALALQESPEARGVLAAFAVDGRPRLLSHLGLPACHARTIDAAATRLLCVRSDTIELWDLATGTVAWTRPLRASEGAILADGSLVLIAGDSIVRYDPDGGLIDDRPAPKGAARIATSTDPGVVVVHSHGGWAWVTDAPPPRTLVDTPEKLLAAALHGADRVAVLRGSGSLELRDAADRLISRHDLRATFPQVDATIAMHWSPSGRWIAMGALDGQVFLFDPATGASRGPIDPRLGPIRDLALDADDQRVAIVSERGVTRIWDLRSGGLLPRLPAGGDRSVRFTAPGQLVVAGDELRRFELVGDGRPHVLPTASGVTSVRVSDTGTVAASSAPGRINLWDQRSGLRLLEADLDVDDVIKGIAFVPDRPLLFGTPSFSHPGFALDTTAPYARRPLEMTAYWRRVEGLAGGYVVGIGYGQGPHVVDVDSWEERRDLVLPKTNWYDLGAQRDGRVAALVEERGGVWLLHADPLHIERIADDPEAVAVDVARDGARVVIGQRSAVRVLDRETGVERRWDLPGARVMEVALSDDGRLAAAGLLSGDVRLWSVDGDKELALLRGHTERAVTLDFSPDGQLLYSGSWDDSVRTWSLASLTADPRQLVQQVEAAWGIDLDRAVGVDLR
ncbi:MAG: protein kinase [Alphaproteobacteria bacterium]|nr:protein kinase [Alphaproteobacteria bacterium]